MTTPKSALGALIDLSDPQNAAKMAAYHKVDRRYLGVSNPQIDGLYKAWRKDTDIAQRVAISAYLWDSDIHEARVAAAKLLTQARIADDGAVWDEICRWAPSFDAWAVADHACFAGGRRLAAHPERVAQVEAWGDADNMWVRRAVLVMTLPWTKLNHPNEADLEIRELILARAASYVPDAEPFIQKSIAWWLRSLSKHDPDRVRVFIAEYGEKMKAFALKEASAHLG